MFNNANILITGGTGSFGKKYIDIILEKNQIFMGNINIDITNDIIELVDKKFKENG